MRVGLGYDIHRFCAGEGLMLGGVWIPCAFGIVAHSDGDVVLHALMDAMLGALALGDIGLFFSDQDAKYADCASSELLAIVQDKIHQQGYRIVNVDCTVMAERPKLKQHRQLMQERMQELLVLAPGTVSVKATTHERLGCIGREEGLAVQAVVLLAQDE